MSESMFYFVVSGLLTLTIVFASLSFFSRQHHARRDILNNARIVKQRLQEIDREFVEGLISKEDRARAETELKLALVDETQPHSDAHHKKTALLPLIVGAVLALGLASWVYVNKNQLSRVEQATNAIEKLPELSRRLAAGDMQSFSQKDLAELALAIRQRLRQSPDDDTGWLYFGRLMMSLEQQQQARQAIERAIELAPQKREYKITLAQILMSISDTPSLEQAKALLLALLSDEPDNDNLALMMAVVSAQLGELESLERFFAQVQDKLPKDSDIGERLATRIKTLREQAQEVSSPQKSQIQTGFTIDISISENAQNTLPSDGFLVVFAQDGDSENNMPAAVIRMPLPSFPVSVQLDSSHAMMPSYSLASLSNVRLTARISKDENVATAKGEWQGSIEAQVNRNILTPVSIIINKEIK